MVRSYPPLTIVVPGMRPEECADEWCIADYGDMQNHLNLIAKIE